MKALPAVILLLLCAIPVQVRAEETPQTMAAELRFGQYGPSIDSEFTGDVSPFWDSFGNESAWLFGGELDYQLWHGFGSVGLFAGGSWGYVSGKGLEADGGESSDSTTLSLAPVAVGAVYRFDVLARRLGIPLVGAFKGGVAYTFWWIRDGVEEIASFETEDMVMDGYGGTWGLHWGIGLHLLLDFFEPHTAKVFDNEMGVNNSYLFAEWAGWWSNDFGSDKSFDLSSNGLVFGLAFEM